MVQYEEMTTVIYAIFAIGYLLLALQHGGLI